MQIKQFQKLSGDLDVSRILLVEDDTNTRNGLCDLLQDEGYEVDAAADFKSALKKINSHFDLLLCDLHLSKKSGLELIRLAYEHDPDVSAIVMTAYASQEFCNEAHEMRIDGWLNKPLNVDELLATLENVIRNSRSKTHA